MSPIISMNTTTSLRGKEQWAVLTQSSKGKDSPPGGQLVFHRKPWLAMTA